MPDRVVSAFCGDQHVPVPAPQWDYANGQKIAFTGGAVLSAVINAPLVRLVATQDCYYAIGANPSASNGAGSVCLPAKTFWAETITAGTKISVVSDGTDGNLFILPAKTEGGA